jgi:hypothetical protein
MTDADNGIDRAVSSMVPPHVADRLAEMFPPKED